jgi:hypothetical protein
MRQFISEFIVDSVEHLERIANPSKPPLDFSAIEAKKNRFEAQSGDMDELRKSLEGMEDAFRKPGDLSSWTPQLLEAIDDCFVKNYMDDDGEAVPSLFFPDSTDNMNRFMTYRTDVDLAIRTHSETAPQFAREYFAYYCIWQMRGWPFPVPLGTASVVGALNKMTKTIKKGFSEVSPSMRRGHFVHRSNAVRRVNVRRVRRRRIYRTRAFISSPSMRFSDT